MDDLEAGEFEVEEERRGVAQVGEVERREHARYSVDGWAEILVADGSMLFRGRVLDISVAGCYIETQARLRLEPGTRVEMVFRVNEMVFRVEALSRMVRPGLGAGFLFLKMKGRMRMGLEDLIRELSG
jgi:PilZ domain